MKTKVAMDEIFDIDESINSENKKLISDAYNEIKNNPIGSKLINILHELLQEYPYIFTRHSRTQGKLKQKNNPASLEPYISEEDWKNADPEAISKFRKILLTTGEKTMFKESNKITGILASSGKPFAKFQQRIILKDFNGVEVPIYDLTKNTMSKTVVPFYVKLAHEMIHSIHFMTNPKEFDEIVSLDNVRTLGWEKPLNDKEGKCWGGLTLLAEVVAVIGRKNPINDYQRISELTMTLSVQQEYIRFPYIVCDIAVNEDTIKELVDSAQVQINSLLNKKK